MSAAAPRRLYNRRDDRSAERGRIPANSDFLSAFEDVSAAVEAGAGLPEVARAAAPGARGERRRSSTPPASVLAVACQSPDDERAVLERHRRQRDARTARRRQRRRPAALPRHAAAPPPPTLAAHGRHADRARGRALARPRAGQRGGRRRASSPTCSTARSPTARTSSPARNELGCDLEPTAAGRSSPARTRSSPRRATGAPAC